MKKTVKTKFRPEFPVDFIFDYKDPLTLQRFVMDAGKITPSRIGKVSMTQQRKVAKAVKKARNLALVPSGTHAYDTYTRPEQISAKPFEF